jgi:hypothetical protein
MRPRLEELAALAQARRSELDRLVAENEKDFDYLLEGAVLVRPPSLAIRVLVPLMVLGAGGLAGALFALGANEVPVPDALAGFVGAAMESLAIVEPCPPSPVRGWACPSKPHVSPEETEAERHEVQEELEALHDLRNPYEQHLPYPQDMPTRSVRRPTRPQQCHMLDGTKVASCERGDSLCTCY